jgi:hypothetical protein
MVQKIIWEALTPQHDGEMKRPIEHVAGHVSALHHRLRITPAAWALVG